MRLKKFLPILSSIGLAAVATIPVVSCSTSSKAHALDLSKEKSVKATLNKNYNSLSELKSDFGFFLYHPNQTLGRRVIYQDNSDDLYKFKVLNPHDGKYSKGESVNFELKMNLFPIVTTPNEPVQKVKFKIEFAQKAYENGIFNPYKDQNVIFAQEWVQVLNKTA